jgi:hypothetical protein
VLVVRYEVIYDRDENVGSNASENMPPDAFQQSAYAFLKGGMIPLAQFDPYHPCSSSRKAQGNPIALRELLKKPQTHPSRIQTAYPRWKMTIFKDS